MHNKYKSLLILLIYLKDLNKVRCNGPSSPSPCRSAHRDAFWHPEQQNNRKKTMSALWTLDNAIVKYISILKMHFFFLLFSSHYCRITYKPTIHHRVFLIATASKRLPTAQLVMYNHALSYSSLMWNACLWWNCSPSCPLLGFRFWSIVKVNCKQGGTSIALMVFKTSSQIVAISRIWPSTKHERL